MYFRVLTPYVLRLAHTFPVISITGPRQSGKTTLVKNIFSNRPYINLEQPDVRERVKDDPTTFLSYYPEGLIIDEIQRVPELFSYLQVYVDEKRIPGRYIISGSENFLLSRQVSQSLAGRVGIAKLLPLGLGEYEPVMHENKSFSLWEIIWRGSYPEVIARQLDPTLWYPSYIETYVERDARALLNIINLNSFRLLMRLLSGRSGQLLNYATLSSDLGVDSKTVKGWISVLTASYLTFTLSSFAHSPTKRTVKTPKLFFSDTGILCSLLGIQSVDQLILHPSRGHIFETWIASELLKLSYNLGLNREYFFWRTKDDKEVDFVFSHGNEVIAIEVKSAATVVPSFFSGLNSFESSIAPVKVRKFLVYGGEEHFRFKDVEVVPWNKIHQVFAGIN